jgi:hypothetical protein
LFFVAFLDILLQTTTFLALLENNTRRRAAAWRLFFFLYKRLDYAGRFLLCRSEDRSDVLTHFYILLGCLYLFP